MTNSMTIFPYEPFELNSGLTIFDFQNKSEYSQLLFRLNKLKHHDTLVDDDDRVIHFYIDPDDSLNEKIKDVVFIGDLTSFEINSSANLKYIFQDITKNSVISRDKIEEINGQINDLVFEAITKYSLPINYDPYSNFEKLLKAKEVCIETEYWKSYCDKIMDIVSFYSEFTTKKLLLFHSLEKLLSTEQLNELNQYLKSVSLNIVSLESYPLSLKDKALDAKVYSIDEDHVRFDY